MLSVSSTYENTFFLDKTCLNHRLRCNSKQKKEMIVKLLLLFAKKPTFQPQNIKKNEYMYHHSSNTPIINVHCLGSNDSDNKGLK